MQPQEGRVIARRRQQLRAVVEAYFKALSEKDFSLIPYDENVVMKSPLSPGRVNGQLIGKEALRTLWWPDLVPVLGEVKLHDIYINERLTAACGFSEITIRSPTATLRVCDRFTVDALGKITEQESHYDPRGLFDPR